jgi:branched-chain amino acid transport system substrate-binding protein
MARPAGWESLGEDGMLKAKQFSRFLAVFAAILLTTCQAASPPFQCTDKIGCMTIGPGEPIKIGMLQTLSGDVGTQGLEQVQSFEVAAAGRAGKLLNHPLELRREDSLCSGEGGTTAALKIVADPQTVAVFGTTCSGEAVTAARIVSEAGLVMISSSNSAPSLTSVGGKQGENWQSGYFRTAHNDADQGRAAATFAVQELGLRKAATINDGDAYTQGLAKIFGQVFTELGGQIVLNAAINKGDTDMKPVLAAVAASDVELLFFPIFPPEGNYIALQAREVEGFEQIALMGGESLLTPAFVEPVGVAGVGMYFVSPQTPAGSAYDNFVVKYQSKYGQSPSTPFVAHSFDAANMMFDAIEKAAIKEQNGTLHMGRQALRDALYDISGYQGLTGTLSCDKFGDCGAASFKVVRLDDPAAGMEGLTDNVVYIYAPGEQVKRQ